MGNTQTVYAICKPCSGRGYFLESRYPKKAILHVGPQLPTRCSRCKGNGKFHIETDGAQVIREFLGRRGVIQRDFAFPREEAVVTGHKEVWYLAKLLGDSAPPTQNTGQKIVLVHRALYIYQLAYGMVPVRFTDLGEMPAEQFVEEVWQWYLRYHVVVPYDWQTKAVGLEPMSIVWAKQQFPKKKPKKEEDED